MIEEKFKTMLTCDYIYIPYSNKEEIKLEKDGIIYKNTAVTNYNGQELVSPVSGKAYGVCEIPSTSGVLNTLIIENDFKDKTKSTIISVSDIYKTKNEDLESYLNVKEDEITLKINNSKNEENLFKDNINEVLETLNLINLKLEKTIKVNINRKDINTYKLLFSYLGTYPNIEITFNKVDKSISLYEIIDIYHKIKNRMERDYIYLTLKQNKESFVVKTKKYSNIKDVLNELNITPNGILINGKIKLESPNYLLDDSVYEISVI